MKKIVSGLLMGLLFVGCAEQETTLYYSRRVGRRRWKSGLFEKGLGRQEI